MAALNIDDLNNAKRDIDHIAEIANSENLTATDRAGHVKPTVKGAINSLKAFNVRGAFVAGAAYQMKDVYTSNGTSYVAIVDHVATTVAADLAAGKVSVHQGVTHEELVAPAGAGLVGRVAPGPGAIPGSVNDALLSLETRYTYNISPATFAITHNANVNGVNYDKNIYLFGDSHSWGQGAPDWDYFQGAVDYSAHSASLYNKGFMARIEAYIRTKCGFDEKVYALNAPGADNLRYLPADVSNAEFIASGADFLANPLQVVSGRPLSMTQAWTNAGSSAKGWFTPFAAGDLDLISMYRDKLFTGRFNKGSVRLYKEDETNFLESGKTEYINLLPLPGVAGSGGTWTAITDNVGNVLAEYDGQSFYIRFNAKCGYADLGFLSFPGQFYFVPGYGKFALSGGIAIGNNTGYRMQVFAADGVSYPAGLEKYIYANMKIYRYEYINSAVLRADPARPFRKLYICVRKNSAGRKIAISLRDAPAGGVKWNPTGHLSAMANPTNRPIWSWGRAGYPIVRLIGGDGGRTDATAWGATVKATSVEIDTYAAAGADVVFEIDFGSKTHCPVYVQDVGNGSGGTNQFTEIRGIIFDNNQVTNYAMGGHTFGQWMGDGPSYNDGARDHLADIIAYAKGTPHLVITQLPIVNEYLRQTPIATFKQNMATFISRLNNTLNGAGGKATDFLFFTTVGGFDVDYGGVVSNPITYDAYVAAARAQCLASGAGLVDCRQMLKDLVHRGVIDAGRLYADNNHPSNFANELIAQKLLSVVDEIV